jgi:Kelch motif protein
VIDDISDHDRYLNAVEAYDLATDSWSPVAPLEVARASLGVAAVGNQLVAIGGEQVPGPEGFLSNVTEQYGRSQR